MQRQGIKPATLTYNALSSACGKGKQLALTRKVFEVMQRRYMEPDATSNDLLIQSCAAFGRSNGALALFAKFATRDISIESFSGPLMECEELGLLSTEVAALSSLSHSVTRSRGLFYRARELCLLAGCEVEAAAVSHRRSSSGRSSARADPASSHVACEQMGGGHQCQFA